MNKTNIFTILNSSFIILAIGIAVAIAAWPYLWFDPIGHAREVIGYFTTVGQGYRIFWDGIVYQVGIGNKLWWYPWSALTLSTPLVFLVLILIGMIRKKTLLIIWLIVPLARTILPNSAFYDGIRHFMEIIPALVLLAAFGIETLGRLGRPGKALVVVVGGLAIAQMLLINATYYPYSTGYYNELAQDPNVRYDRDIEALSVKEGIMYLHNTYGPISLWSPLGGHLSWYYLTSGDQYVYYPAAADSIILINKSSHVRQAEFDEAIQPTFRLDHVISRGDMIVGWVYRKKM